MRIILVVLMVGASLTVPLALVSVSVSQGVAQAQITVEQLGPVFSWPKDTGTSADDPQVALNILSKAADATSSNIIRTLIRSSDAGRSQITYFIYLGSIHTQLFDGFFLATGRWLTRAEANSGSAVVTSTPRELAGDVVGVVSVLGNAYDLTFAPLHQALVALPATGQYVVESPTLAQANQFFAHVRQQLQALGVTNISSMEGAAGGDDIDQFSLVGLNYLPYFLVALASILMVSILVRDGKRIGVMRLFGHSTARVWYEVIGKLQLFSVGCATILCGVILLLIPGTDPAFRRTLGLLLLLQTVTCLGATIGFGLFVVRRIHVGELIKGRLQ